jgi:hypothetical protein
MGRMRKRTKNYYVVRRKENYRSRERHEDSSSERKTERKIQTTQHKTTQQNTKQHKTQHKTTQHKTTQHNTTHILAYVGRVKNVSVREREGTNIIVCRQMNE